MRSILLACLSAAVLSVTGAPARAQATPHTAGSRASVTSEAAVRGYVDAVLAKRWDDAARYFPLERNLTGAMLESAWTRYLADAGPLRKNSIVRSRRTTRDEVVVALDFESRAITLHFVLEVPGAISNGYMFFDKTRSVDAPDLNVLGFLRWLGGLGTVANDHGVSLSFERVGPRVQSTQFSNPDGRDRRTVLTYTPDAVGAIVRLEGPALSNPIVYTVERQSNFAFKLTAAGVESIWTFSAPGRGVEIRTAGYERPAVYRSTPEAIAQFEAAVERNRSNARIMAENAVHEARAAQRENAEAEQEDRRMRAASVNKMLGDLSAHAARESQIRAEADAMVARIASEQAVARERQQARAAAEQAAAREEQQARADARAREADQRREDARQAAAASSAAAAVQRAGSAGTSGALTTSPATRPATSGRASTSAGSSQRFIACRVLKPGAFDQHKGAIFFSTIVPVTVPPGQQAPDLRQAFLQKVRTAYSLTGGHPGCWTGSDAAEVQRQIDDMASVSSYRSHKKVNTGIAP